MIFQMIFLFLVLLCATAVIYYLYAFFIPALKLKNKEYNDLLASNFNFENEFEDTNASYNILFPEERKNDAIFDSIYRSKVNNEKICVFFDENGLDSNDFSSENYDFNDKNLQKKSAQDTKCFKFWIYCYKLLERRKSAKS